MVPTGPDRELGLADLGEALHSLRRDAMAFARDWAPEGASGEASWLLGDSAECTRALAARGWIGMTWPEPFGGHGRPEIERALVAEVLIAHGVPIASGWFADRQIGPVLVQFGSEEQCARWLPGILAGKARWCIGMSEPDAGSDVASIATSAVRDRSEFVVSGRKLWTSGADLADHCYLICRTDPTAPRHLGLSELVVDMGSPGISVRPVKDASGGSHFCEVVFDEVRVPSSNLVGEENGCFRQVMRQLEHERGGIDRLVSNRRMYLATRRRYVAADDLRRQEIARLESEYLIGRRMVLALAAGARSPAFSAVTKVYCTEFEQRVARFVTASAGPDSLLDGDASHSGVYANAYTIMGGTSAVLRNVIGERLLGLPRA